MLVKIDTKNEVLTETKYGVGSLSWSVSKNADPKSASFTVEKFADTKMLSNLIDQRIDRNVHMRSTHNKTDMYQFIIVKRVAHLV